jgi:hypothetical protein
MSKCFPIKVCSDGDRRKKLSAANLVVAALYSDSATLDTKKFSRDSISWSFTYKALMFLGHLTETPFLKSLYVVSWASFYFGIVSP